MKAVMLCDSNYATDKDTRKSVSCLVATLRGKLLMCLLKTHRTVKLLTCDRVQDSHEEQYF